MRGGTIVGIAIAFGCASESVPSSDAGSSGIDLGGTAGDATAATTGPSLTTSTPSGDSSTGAVTTFPMTDSGDPTGGPSSTTTTAGGPPAAPGCSVQEVTEYALTDPLLKGAGAGVFPTLVGDTLEDYCGCHTLMSGAQNVKYMFLQAPGGSLFLEYGDMMRAYKGGVLSDAIDSQVAMTSAMPPGSCYFPPDKQDILVKWIGDGFPDGANFTYP